ncbi:MBL fold metallo-hydrolase [Streptomyces polygonati]|uniref:MBL fold metallo-hydrolase n=1 Tax=Streptomyces polygonati TaxID=1617087 RepID=A0ABV8HHR9_9ACTN
MRTVELSLSLYQLRFDVGHAYLWRDADDSLTLIDTGTVGSGEAIAESIRGLGLGPEQLRRVVVTHAHQDHTGALAEIAAWGGEVTVMAHRLEAPLIRGESPAAEPVFDQSPDWERALYENMPPLPPAPPARVDRELADGDVLDFGGGAQVIGVPGHTDGSIALYLPGPGVVFTGDAAANVEGRTMLGVFNVARDRAVASLRKLADLGAETACFGHGEPLTRGASAALRTAEIPVRES